MSVSAVRAVAITKTWWAALLVALALTGVLAPRAGAVLVHWGPKGSKQAAGVLPRRGVNPASIPGSFARHSASTRTAATTGNLAYQGGPVLHAESPYLIFWDPGNQITAQEKANLAQYFADAAAGSGSQTNIYGVDRQFTDTTGFADYKQTWASSQAITDTQAYPSSGQCDVSARVVVPTCLYDSQIQAEVARLVNAQGLPTGTSGSAPIYFVVTPPSVDTCDTGGSTVCADNYYCAYHGIFRANSHNILYADMPTYLDSHDPKGCQSDGNTQVQAPNGDQVTDVVTSSMSHEFSETITDPVTDSTLGNGGWYDPVSGNEDGDNCAFKGAFDPANGYNPDAFLPVLGGSATGTTHGTLYDQLINGHQYYTQTEWSNGDATCKAEPTSSALAANFTGPSTATPGTPVSFDPSSSTNAGAISSTTWSFGDGTTSFSTSPPTTIPHTFSPLKAAFTAPIGPLQNTSVSFDGSGSSASATDNVTLTLVDQYGNLSTASQPVSVSNAGGPITHYSWDFGDGSSSGQLTTATTSHTYTTFGRMTVSLTVTNSGYSNTTSHVVTVDAPPFAAFSAASPPPAVGLPTSFDASASGELGGMIASYSWAFGDGATGTGAAPSHTYSTTGTKTVVLTVTDQDGHTATTSHDVSVGHAPVAAFGVPTSAPMAGSPVAFDGSASSEQSGSITGYSWDFGDGTVGSGSTPSHTYTQGGTYDVGLTVTDQVGRTAQVTHQVQVAPVPSAAFTMATPSPVTGSPVAFDGSGSAEPGGSISGYSWNFGDGAALGGGSAITHTYSTAGTYTVVLTVTDPNGRTATASHTVSVASAPPPPTTVGVPSASILLRNAHPIAGMPVALNGAGSSDRGSSLVSYVWSFGDGSTATGVTPSHVYTRPGVYKLSLTVRDATGASATASQSVTVASAGISGVKIKTRKKVEQLTLTFSGPGTLRAGKQKLKVKRAGSLKLSLKLSSAQKHSLSTHHAVAFSVKLVFTPTVGSSSSRTVKFKIAP
jgi:PKD repeat protein